MLSNAHLRNPPPIRAAMQINQTVSSAHVPSQMRPAPQTVIIPAPTTIPQYPGTPSEKPLQFLLRLQHFAPSMYGWTDTVFLDVADNTIERLKPAVDENTAKYETYNADLEAMEDTFRKVAEASEIEEWALMVHRKHRVIEQLRESRNEENADAPG
ncbi:unnamed protein product [Didymodactylos carnosus]|uniref:Uncharacterized protein n=1 Tax=Didymodactylos carnosus TaxID=1234261 RepID=A0A814GAF4_9BILA|nr:unnamed protein product [Didymodactylos carnosus]CAF0994265.1 unnamed protein product [Didymodactylos carnosus]CAF3745855.1 unnamed protein product [Didymodactylos carnosus]CAF3765995.1 unnamed protein product [Didymodactylos carnosus]